MNGIIVSHSSDVCECVCVYSSCMFALNDVCVCVCLVLKRNTHDYSDSPSFREQAVDYINSIRQLSTISIIK